MWRYVHEEATNGAVQAGKAERGDFCQSEQVCQERQQLLELVDKSNGQQTAGENCQTDVDWVVSCRRRAAPDHRVLAARLCQLLVQREHKQQRGLHPAHPHIDLQRHSLCKRVSQVNRLGAFYYEHRRSQSDHSDAFAEEGQREAKQIGSRLVAVDLVQAEHSGQSTVQFVG